MATSKEIELAGEIHRVAIRVNIQGKYHAFVEFSGHVHAIYVYLKDAKTGKNIDAFAEHDQHVYLSTDYRLSFGESMKSVIVDKVAQLEKLKADLLKFLDVDADGVPV
jgi:hypothetical protein